MSNSRPQVLVGVQTGTGAAVVEAEAGLADQLGADLACAHVDDSSEQVGQQADGTVVSTPLNPDLSFTEKEPFDSGLRAEIGGILDPRPVKWSVRALADGEAQQLAGLAQQLDAAMIVVGTREAGSGAPLRSFHWVRRRSAIPPPARPVVMFPLTPVPDDGLLPWERTE
ncbi:universal stress protein [Arthrobacter sp. Helios]|uniref:universal stress protein n=1 Tax=Arthrobacter sp. Helios TaxID=2828862 RepID=UPI002062E056|nr:universal stress protein [Arthrobacter sp. Helios]UPO78447.1 universal stress protein [Arthrobacter sp. Helios]